jgi:mRNA interferase MazF
MVGIGRDAPVGPRRGDVVLAELPDVGGAVIRGPHPVVLIQNDRLARSSTFVVLPLTSAARAAEFRPPFLVEVLARRSGLNRDGWAKCDQPLTLPAERLGQRIGRLDPETLSAVDAALRFVLAV